LADTKYVVNVEGAIVRGNKYLMIVRGRGEAHAGGTLSFVGGKVDTTQNFDHILEETLRREIMEEVGVQVSEMAYVQSSHFIADDDDLVVDIIFLCKYDTGEAQIVDVEEVEKILWLSSSEVMNHALCPPWTKSGMQRVELLRQQLNW